MDKVNSEWDDYYDFLYQEQMENEEYIKNQGLLMSEKLKRNDIQVDKDIDMYYKEYLYEQKQIVDEIENDKLSEEIRKQNNGSRENRIGLLLFIIGIFGIIGGIMGYSGLWAISWLVGPGFIMMTS